MQLEDAHQELAALQGELAAAAEQQQALDTYAQRRLAGLRWRWAAAAVLLPRRQAPPLLGHAGQLAAQHSSGSPLVQQLAALEAAAAAALQAWQQLREHRQRGRAEAALAAALGAPGSNSSSSTSTSGGGHTKPRMPSRLGASSGSSSSSSSSTVGPVAGHTQQPPLACLRPEARAAVLLSLPAAQRQQALAGMPDGERAALVLHWDEATRAQVGGAAMRVRRGTATLESSWARHALISMTISKTRVSHAPTAKLPAPGFAGIC